MRQTSLTGIILRKKSIAENDHHILIYSAQYGKLSLFSKGSQKFLSRRLSSFEIGNICQIQLYKNYIQQSSLIENFKNAKSTIEKIITTLNLIELIEKLTALEYPYPKHYQLAQKSLENLNRYQDSKVVIPYFIIKHLTLFGLLNDLNRCTECHLPHSGKAYICPKNSRIICEKCLDVIARPKAEAIPWKNGLKTGLLRSARNDRYFSMTSSDNSFGMTMLLPDTIKILSFIQKNTFEEIIQTPVISEKITEIAKITDILIQDHLHTPLKSTTIRASLV